MEKIINNRLIWYLEHNNLLTKEQSGFRNGRSTIDSLLNLEIEIQNAFDNRQHLIGLKPTTLPGDIT